MALAGVLVNLTVFVWSSPQGLAAAGPLARLAVVPAATGVALLGTALLLLHEARSAQAAFRALLSLARVQDGRVETRCVPSGLDALTLTAPLSGRLCAAYRVAIEERVGTGRYAVWCTVASETRASPILVERLRTTHATLERAALLSDDVARRRVSSRGGSRELEAFLQSMGVTPRPRSLGFRISEIRLNGVVTLAVDRRLSLAVVGSGRLGDLESRLRRVPEGLPTLVFGGLGLVALAAALAAVGSPS